MSLLQKIANADIARTQNITQDITKDVTQATAQTLDVVGDKLEQKTNVVLHFLGVPIDVDTLTTHALEWSGKLVLALIIFFLGKWIGRRIIGVAKEVMSRSHMDVTVANFLGNVLYGLMLVAVTLAALNKLGINTNSFVAILGGAAVAIGVSLKDQLGNLAAGVMIVIFRPFNRGDVVEIAGQVGTVLNIALVNTRIQTANNHEIIIPNGDIMTSASINFTSLPTRRVEVPVAINHETPIGKGRAVLLHAAKVHQKVLDMPEPIVRVTGLDDKTTLTLYAWCENADWWAVQCDLLEMAKNGLDGEGIKLAVPKVLNLRELGATGQEDSKKADVDRSDG